MQEKIMRGSYELSERQVIQSALKLELISKFVLQEGMRLIDYTVMGKTIRVIDDIDTTVDGARLVDYLGAHARAKERGIINNCYDIARTAVSEGCATGRIRAQDGTNKFVTYLSHCICYDELEDGRCVAVDLTASANIDERAGNFDVLAVVAPDVNILLHRVGRLFGGNWSLMQEHELY